MVYLAGMPPDLIIILIELYDECSHLAMELHWPMATPLAECNLTCIKAAWRLAQAAFTNDELNKT
jgi:hypothetical protein